MPANRRKNRTLVMEPSDTVLELGSHTVNNNKEPNDQPQIVNKDVNVRTELTETINTISDEEANDPTINSELSNTLNSLDLVISDNQTFDHEQLAITVENPDNTPHTSIFTNRRIVDVTFEKLISTEANVVDALRTDFDPVMEYADEPLLPLFEACAPLTDIIDNLSFYVEKALKDTPEKPPDSLTVDESAAIRLYTMEWVEPHQSLYFMLNHTLKKPDRTHLQPYFKYLKLFLTALVKLPCVPPLTVWRGVRKDLSAQFPPGTRVTWWGFSSCTTELTVLENNMFLGNTGDRTLFSVEAINGRTVRAHSHFPTEDEIILLPGTHMTVKSQFSPASDLHIIHLMQVKPQEMLLEAPFEGKRNASN